MDSFVVFFLSIIHIIYHVWVKYYKFCDVVSIRSTVDGLIYIVRKGPNAKKASNKLAEIKCLSNFINRVR